MDAHRPCASLRIEADFKWLTCERFGANSSSEVLRREHPIGYLYRATWHQNRQSVALGFLPVHGCTHRCIHGDRDYTRSLGHRLRSHHGRPAELSVCMDRFLESSSGQTESSKL